VGKITVDPNAGNVIPGSVKASLDVRHLHDFVRRAAVEQLLESANAIAARRGLTLQQERQLDQSAVPMDERLTTFLADAVEAVGLPVKHMPSGAGHDAMVMAARVPTAMLFLRSPGGISHHPDETVREEDVEAALQTGGKFLARFAASIR
jgi:allantoate deiminase